MNRTLEEIQDTTRDELQARFDSEEFFCEECHQQGGLRAAFLLSSVPRGSGEVSEKHLSWSAPGFCCRHLSDRADKAYADASAKIESAKTT